MEVKKQIKLNVEGMTCGHCANSIKRYLITQGLADISVSHASGEVYFTLNSLDGRIDLLKEGIEALGYKVNTDKEKN